MNATSDTDVGESRRLRRRSAEPDGLPDFRERIDRAVDLAGGTMPIAVVVDDADLDAAKSHLAGHGHRARPVEIQSRRVHLEETARRPHGSDDA